MDNNHSGRTWRDEKQVNRSETDNPEEEEIPTLTRQEIEETNQPNNEKKGRNIFYGLRPFFTAVFSALLIGSLLGFLMINMFTNLDKNTNQNDDLVAAHTDPDHDDNAVKEDKTEQLDAIELEAISAYVLQVGVFSERKNADEWITTFEQAGFPTTIWEKDDLLYLLAGVTVTEEQANALVSDFSDLQFDVYIKEWKTNEVDVELTEEEMNWLQSFHAKWNNALESLNKQEGILMEDWDRLLENAPDAPESINKLVDRIKKEKDTKKGEWEAHIMLLNIWQEYEKLF